jgi:hypothetical protein
VNPPTCGSPPPPASRRRRLACLTTLSSSCLCASGRDRTQEWAGRSARRKPRPLSISVSVLLAWIAERESSGCGATQRVVLISICQTTLLKVVRPHLVRLLSRLMLLHGSEEGLAVETKRQWSRLRRGAPHTQR